ncbi:MAG: spondin domain-containing protein [Halobacteriovoraceae bacterium]|nr:spondin domain-containing protein [Halobacteriovoraceae bacterium]
MKTLLKTLALGIILVQLIPSTLAEESATYEVTLKVQFEKQNFNNKKFPRNPHFSPLVITTHSPAFDLFKQGTLATQGVVNVAETGSPVVLNQELDEQIMMGTSFERTQTGGLSGTDEVKTTITVTKDFPLISAITMIAPSPDWIVGISGLSLLKGDTFIKQLEIPLYAIDAGSDNGKYYESSNSETTPRAPISLLKNVSGLSIENSFGTLTINKL